MRTKVRVGLVGLGNWGIKIYRTIKNNFPNLVIHSVSIKTGKNLKFVSKNIKIYKNWNKMITKERLDCIFVALPPKNNFKIFKKVMKKKIPLFLEKPMATNIKDAKKMLNIYRKSKSVVHVNHIDLFNNAIQYLRKKSKNIKKISFQISNSIKTKNYISPFLDMAPHAIAVSLVFFKKNPFKLYAQNVPIDKNLKMKRGREMVNLKMHFSKNRSAEILVGNGTIKKIREAKFYDKNKIFFYQNNSKNLLTVINKNKKISKVKRVVYEPSLNSSIKYFLKRKTKKPNDVELGLKVLKILNLSIKSLQTNKAVIINQ